MTHLLVTTKDGHSFPTVSEELTGDERIELEDMVKHLLSSGNGYISVEFEGGKTFVPFNNVSVIQVIES